MSDHIIIIETDFNIDLLLEQLLEAGLPLISLDAAGRLILDDPTSGEIDSANAIIAAHDPQGDTSVKKIKDAADVTLASLAGLNVADLDNAQMWTLIRAVLQRLNLADENGVIL